MYYYLLLLYNSISLALLAKYLFSDLFVIIFRST